MQEDIGRTKPDKAATSGVSACPACGIQFKGTRRKHHCKACGQVGIDRHYRSLKRHLCVRACVRARVRARVCVNYVMLV